MEDELEVKEVTPDILNQEQPELEAAPEQEQPIVDEPPVVDEPKNETPPTQEIELDDDKVLKYLSEKHSLSAENIDSLKPKEQTKLHPSVEAYNKFVSETGNTSVSDFLETQKDWSQEPNEVKLMQYLKIENPSLNDSQLAFLYNKRYNTADLDESIDEVEIMEKQINQTTDLRKAEQLLEERKQSFMAHKGLDELVPEEFRQAKDLVDSYSTQQQQANEFNSLKAAEYFNDDFKGFEYQIKVGDKIESLVLKPENVADAKGWHGSIENLNKMFFDENGKVKDPNALFKISEIARMGVDKFTEKLSNTIAARIAEEEDKTSKNISLTEDRQLESPLPKLEVKVVG